MTKEELIKEAQEQVNYCTPLYPECFIQGYVASAEPREKRIAELEAQIEKMKNCKNCANYMISGKCPSFFRTGWCKNWEMTKE